MSAVGFRHGYQPTHACFEVTPRTLPHSPEWHEQRREGIGGSDASVVMGRNPWKTRADLWAEKRGLTGPDPAGEAAYWGTRLEPILRDEFSNRHLKDDLVVEQVSLLRSLEYPFLQSNLDGLVYEGSPVEGARPVAVLEIKTASAFSKEWDGDGEVGEHALWQVQHNLAVTGLDRAYVVALIGGQRYVERVIERDQDLIDILVAHEVEFWQYVEDSDTPPPEPDEAPAPVEGETKVAPSDVVEDVIAFNAARDKVKHYEEVMADLRKRIEGFMESAEVLSDVGGNVLVTWKATHGRRFDTRRFQKDHPDLASEYQRTYDTRTFIVK